MSSIPVIVDVELRAYGVGNYPARATGNLKEFTAHNLSMTFDQIGFAVTPATKPSVASFDVTGDDGPAVGSIAAKVYTYRGAVSQPAHASAVRIVGFEGMEANPSSVASLATIAEADWPDFSGSVTIPAGVSLDSAGDVYTIRLEVYGEGQDLTDSPVAYHDYRITAHATTSLAHFGRVLYVEGETEAQRAAAIVFASDDIESIGASGVDGKTWTVSGIPDDGNHYLPYWLVPASATQPVNWTTGGININNFFAATVDVTLGGVDYKAYLFANSNRQDHGYNGATIVTGV